MKSIREKATMMFRSTCSRSGLAAETSIYTVQVGSKTEFLRNEEDRSKLQEFEVFRITKSLVYCCSVRDSIYVIVFSEESAVSDHFLIDDERSMFYSIESVQPNTRLHGKTTLRPQSQMN